MLKYRKLMSSIKNLGIQEQGENCLDRETKTGRKVNEYWIQNSLLINKVQMLEEQIQRVRGNWAQKQAGESLNAKNSQTKETQHKKKIEQLQQRLKQLQSQKQKILQKNGELDNTQKLLRSLLQRTQSGNKELQSRIQSLNRQRDSLAQQVSQDSDKVSYLTEKNRLLQMARLRLFSMQSDLINLKVRLNDANITQQQKSYQQLLMVKLSQSLLLNSQKQHQKTEQQPLNKPDVQLIPKEQIVQVESQQQMQQQPSERQASVPMAASLTDADQNSKFIREYFMATFGSQEQIQKRYHQISSQTVQYWQSNYNIILSPQRYRLGHLEHELTRPQFYQKIIWNHIQDADFSNSNIDNTMWRLISDNAPNRFNNIKILWLNHNKITQLSQTDLEKFPNLRFISLEKNQLSHDAINQLRRYKENHHNVEIKLTINNIDTVIRIRSTRRRIR